MTINDKIKQILIDKNLTPSYFADEIGVQRSSISHILSGRNRPSFDIIQKIIRRFPELGYDWIMEEENSSHSLPHTTNSSYSSRPVGRPANERTDRYNTNPSSSSVPPSLPGFRSQRTEIPPVSLPTFVQTDEPVANMDASPAHSLNTDKKVERILIFYTDGSFKEYTPSN